MTGFFLSSALGGPILFGILGTTIALLALPDPTSMATYLVVVLTALGVGSGCGRAAYLKEIAKVEVEVARKRAEARRVEEEVLRGSLILEIEDLRNTMNAMGEELSRAKSAREELQGKLQEMSDHMRDFALSVLRSHKHIIEESDLKNE